MSKAESSFSAESGEASDLEDDQDIASDNERVEIRDDLKNMTFEELTRLKEELGSKVYNEAVFGATSKKSEKSVTTFKRENKNRPRETSSKRQVPLVSKAKAKPTEIRDPRFDAQCGEFDSKTFKDNYQFINDIRQREIRLLKKKLKRSKDENKKELKLLIQRLENQIQEEDKRKKKEVLLKEEKDKIQKAREEGKQPYYLKKKELKAKELVQQFIDLKESGRLTKHLEKKRKKNAAKDRKKINLD